MSNIEDHIDLSGESDNRFSQLTEDELKSYGGTKNLENFFMDVVKKLNDQRSGGNIINESNLLNKDSEDEKSKMMNFIIEKTRHQTKIETLEGHVVILENLIDQLRDKENEITIVIKTYEEKNIELISKIEILETELFEKIEENIKLKETVEMQNEKMKQYFFFSTILFSVFIAKYLIS